MGNYSIVWEELCVRRRGDARLVFRFQVFLLIFFSIFCELLYDSEEILFAEECSSVFSEVDQKESLNLRSTVLVEEVEISVQNPKRSENFYCMHLVQEKVLLLEPTDDGTPNLQSISLLESAVERNLHISSRSPQKSVAPSTTNSKIVVDIIDTSYQRRIFNEPEDSNECHRPIYQHQVSVPQFRQPPLPRRRRTSLIERCTEHPIPIPTSGGRQQHQRHCNITGDDVDNVDLHLTNFIHVPYERGIRSTSLNARDRVLRRCNQSEPLDFSIVYSENVLRHCRKIGEGVYGEVFMNKTVRGEAVVLKIIPIEGSIEVNGEPQKKFDEILSEIVIAMELSSLRDDRQFMTGGFVEVRKVCCVQGRYPDHLIDLWELYRDNCGTENDHPEIFPDDQLYLIFELANGGQDLEAFTFQNALQSYSAFIQTALTLAVAEQKFQFEHRDLHWGNILLAPTDDTEIIFRLNGEEIKIPSHGVKVTIIDYTLSRMVYDDCCLYNDLSTDVELFLATGDYQFDIYRFMKQHLKNKWESFEPYTNILWLHYTIDKMISGARYRCSKSKKHRSAIQDMMRLRDELLDYKSASDYVECLK